MELFTYGTISLIPFEDLAFCFDPMFQVVTMLIAALAIKLIGEACDCFMSLLWVRGFRCHLAVDGLVLAFVCHASPPLVNISDEENKLPP